MIKTKNEKNNRYIYIIPIFEKLDSKYTMYDGVLGGKYKNDFNAFRWNDSSLDKKVHVNY